MEIHNFDKPECDVFSMNKSSEADAVEYSETVGMCKGYDGDILDPMPGSVQDGPDYVSGILAEFEHTQDLLEDVECRLSVSAMVSDAVTNGVANALMEEASEALAAKEAEIFALNDKLEDQDLKLWHLTETLRLKEHELAMVNAENNSDRERMVSDFMHDKERMKRRLVEAEARCFEKEKKLKENTEAITKMTSKLEADKNRVIAMEEKIKSLQEVAVANKREILDLVEQLERMKSQNYFMNASTMEEDMQRVILNYGGQLVEKEECEAQMLRHEIERCVCESIYEGQLLEMQDKLETDMLQSRSMISCAQKEMENVKELSKSKLMKKSLEVMDFTERLKENEVSNELQTSVILSVLESSIQELQYQISQYIEDLGFRDEQITSLTCMLNHLKQDCESLQSQISSNHVIDAEIENNLSTLKATMENQCTRLKQDLEEERARGSDDLSRITRLQVQNDSLADRLREQQGSLEQVEEKLAEHQLQQGIERLFAKEVCVSKLNEAVQLITDLDSELEKKDAEVSSYLESKADLESALNAERLEFLRLKKILKGFEFQTDSLSSIGLQKMDSAFEKIDSKLLKMALRLDSFQKNFNTSFENIQCHVALLQEELLEKQWRQDFEEDINGLVLKEFFQGLEGQLKAKEQEERKFWAIQVRLDEKRVTLINEIKALREELDHLKFDEPGKSTFTVDGSNSNGESTDGQRKDWAMRRFSTGQVCTDTPKADDICASQCTQEVKNGEVNDGQRKDWALRRFSTGQVCTDTTKADDSCASQSTQGVKNGEANDGQRKDWALRRYSTGQISASKLDDSCRTAVTGNVAEAYPTKELDLSVHTAIEFADNPESPLKSMSKEQLVLHFKRVLAEQKRQTDCFIGEKTEEIYRLKRDLFKDGTHLKKDKELNILKKRISEITRKLDNVVEENAKLSSCVVEDQDQNYELVCKLKDEMQAERRHLLAKVREKENELKALSDKLSDASRKDTDHSIRESHLLNSIADMESERKVIDIMHLYEVDILITLFQETVSEKDIALNLILKEQDENIKQKISLEKMVHEKDRAMDMVFGEKEGLKRQVVSLEKLIEDEKNASGLVPSQLKEIEQIEKQKISLDLALKDCEELKKQSICLESILHDKEDSMDSARREQEELRKQVLSLKEFIEEKDKTLKMTLTELEKARKENIKLERFIQDKENMIDLSIKKEQYQMKQFEAIITKKENALALAARNDKEHKETITSLQKTLKHKELCLQSAMEDKEEGENQKYLFQAEVQRLKTSLKNLEVQTETAQKLYKIELTKFVHKIMDTSLQLEHNAMKNIEENMLRLERSKQHMKKLQGQVDMYALGNSYYKDKLEKKCRNLLKAEEEVDLLGDEVDALLSLLEKVYAALDHYLPVLQHYPG
ncbi:hypothetical protein KI387_032360, partial [Taxus chinensis]